MNNTDPLLAVRNLTVSLKVGNVDFNAVSNVSFDIMSGETLCLVGESGCGKSMTALSIMRLIPEIATITSGCIFFEGRDIVKISGNDIRNIRGSRIGIVFQEPMTSLNPVITIGDQIAEVIICHQKISKKNAMIATIDMLKLVGVPDAEKRLREYPHQLSGGLRQRVMIAIALACRPSLLIADEPTTALDVTVQGQILALLSNLAKEYGMGLLLITHDLGVVAAMANNVGVMYAGHIVEYGSVQNVLNAPQHPYTKGLLRSVPKFNMTRKDKLYAISGSVPSSAELATMQGCPFRPRCPSAGEECCEMPLMRKLSERNVACWKAV